MAVVWTIARGSSDAHPGRCRAVTQPEGGNGVVERPAGILNPTAAAPGLLPRTQ
jgi:hypothetical protein